MCKRIAAAVAGLLLAVGVSVGLPATPAAAHHYDGWSHYYCIKHRPSNTSVIHSWPYALWPGGVGYWCHAASLSSGASWHYWVNVHGGPGSPYSVRPWQYQPCWRVPCRTAGH